MSASWTSWGSRSAGAASSGPSRSCTRLSLRSRPPLRPRSPPMLSRRAPAQGPSSRADPGCRVTRLVPRVVRTPAAGGDDLGGPGAAHSL
eukprot:12106759-Alexandrium_andersonii.AAC.1